MNISRYPLALIFPQPCISALSVTSMLSCKLSRIWYVIFLISFFSFIITQIQGFYIPSTLGPDPRAWKPALSEPLDLSVEYQMTMRSRVLKKPLLLLHFVLEGIKTDGCPPYLVNTFLQGFLQPTALRFEEIRFNFNAEADVQAFQKRMETLLLTLQR